MADNNTLNPSQTITACAAAVAAVAVSLSLRGVVVYIPLIIAPSFALAATAGIKQHGFKALLSEGLDMGAIVCGNGETTKATVEVIKKITIPSFSPVVAAPAHDPTTLDFWTSKRALNTKIMVGGRGMGKTFAARNFALQILESGARLQIADRHSDKTEWFPGMERAHFEAMFLLKTASAALTALVALGMEVSRRIDSPDSSDTDSQPQHLMIDEWGGCWSEWSSTERESAINALKRISEEGRKYGINCTVILHELTKSGTGISQSISGAADLYIFGDALSNTTWPWPASLSDNRAALTAQRLALLSNTALAVQRAVIVRDSSGVAVVAVSPDLSSSEPRLFELESDQARDAESRMNELYEPGISLTAFSNALGITNRRDTHPPYARAKLFWQEKQVLDNK